MKNLAGFIFVALAVLTASAGLLPPETGIGWKDGWVEEWKGDVPGLLVEDRTEEASNNLVKVVRRWEWTGKAPLEKVTLSVRYRVEATECSRRGLRRRIVGYGTRPAAFYGNASGRRRAGACATSGGTLARPLSCSIEDLME